jgi:hypothetical protein
MTDEERDEGMELVEEHQKRLPCPHCFIEHARYLMKKDGVPYPDKLIAEIIHEWMVQIPDEIKEQLFSFSMMRVVNAVQEATDDVPDGEPIQ